MAAGTPTPRLFFLCSRSWERVTVTTGPGRDWAIGWPSFCHVGSEPLAVCLWLLIRPENRWCCLSFLYSELCPATPCTLVWIHTVCLFLEAIGPCWALRSRHCSNRHNKAQWTGLGRWIFQRTPSWCGFSDLFEQKAFINNFHFSYDHMKTFHSPVFTFSPLLTNMVNYSITVSVDSLRLRDAQFVILIWFHVVYSVYCRFRTTTCFLDNVCMSLIQYSLFGFSWNLCSPADLCFITCVSVSVTFHPHAL